MSTTRRSPTEPSLTDRISQLGYRYLPRLIESLPPALTRRLTERVAELVVAANPPAVRQLRDNLVLATHRPVTRPMLRRAVTSWLRTFIEVGQLGHRQSDRLLAGVRMKPQDLLRLQEYQRSAGLVVALPHTGNWDLAGAFAASTGFSVLTVAEHLAEPAFSDFVQLRRSLGVEVLAHDDPGVVKTLRQGLRSGQTICLIADRDLSGAGHIVDWAGQRASLPLGPALIARSAQAVLLPAATHYEGEELVVTVGQPVTHRPGRAGLAEMTQEIANWFGGFVSQHATDWHLLQPFFLPPAATLPAQKSDN